MGVGTGATINRSRPARRRPSARYSTWRGGRCSGAQEHDRLPFHKLVAAVNPPGRPVPAVPGQGHLPGAWRSGASLPDLEVVPREMADPVMDLDLTADVSGETDRLRLEVLF